MLLTQERNRMLWLLKIPPTVRAWLFGILLLAAVLLLASFGDCEADQGAYTNEAQPHAALQTSSGIRPRDEGNAHTSKEVAEAGVRLCEAKSACLLRTASLPMPQDRGEATTPQ